MPTKPKNHAKPVPPKPNRPKTERTRSSAAIGIAAAAAAVAGGIAAAFRFGLIDRAIAKAGKTGAEHPAPDLAAAKPRPGPADRAPEAFRPDPTAPVSAAEREALRPATVPIGGTPDRHSEAVR